MHKKNLANLKPRLKLQVRPQVANYGVVFRLFPYKVFFLCNVIDGKVLLEVLSFII